MSFLQIIRSKRKKKNDNEFEEGKKKLFNKLGFIK